jgi:putative phosphoserine phosphatase/1-acylglycerol-3-phosphate O-acyltransferase
VDRANRKKAVSSVKRLGADLRRHKLTTLIAPEGTRSRSGELQPFKMGAFHLALDTGAPIVPMVLHGVHMLMPPDDWRLRPGTVQVDVHPPIDTSGWVRDDLRAHANELNDRFAQWLDAGPNPPPSSG